VINRDGDILLPLYHTWVIHTAANRSVCPYKEKTIGGPGHHLVHYFDAFDTIRSFANDTSPAEIVRVRIGITFGDGRPVPVLRGYRVARKNYDDRSTYAHVNARTRRRRAHSSRSFAVAIKLFEFVARARAYLLYFGYYKVQRFARKS